MKECSTHVAYWIWNGEIYLVAVLNMLYTEIALSIFIAWCHLFPEFTQATYTALLQYSAPEIIFEGQ